MFGFGQLKSFSKKKKKPILGNEIDQVGTEEMTSEVIPSGFKNMVQEAILNYNRRTGIEGVEVESSEHQWKNADGNFIKYTLHCGDVRALDKFMEKKCYTLGIADIPYGFNALGSESDEQPFSEEDVVDMVNCFSKVTTSTLWRFVVIHSLQQSGPVMSALGKTCNAGVEAGIWEKPNVHAHPSRNRLAWAFECWSIGYHHEWYED